MARLSREFRLDYPDYQPSSDITIAIEAADDLILDNLGGVSDFRNFVCFLESMVCDGYSTISGPNLVLDRDAKEDEYRPKHLRS